MRPLTRKLPPARREWHVPVSQSGTVCVLNNLYSVPSGLAGREVTARVSEWTIEIWYANRCIDAFPRITATCIPRSTCCRDVRTGIQSRLNPAR